MQMERSCTDAALISPWTATPPPTTPAGPCRRPMLNGRTMSLARPAHTASIVILRCTQAPLLRVLSCQSQPGAGLCHRLRTEHKTGAEGRRCGRRQAVHTFTAHMLQCNAHRWPMNSVSQERKIEGCYIATPSSLGLPGGAGWRQHAAAAWGGASLALLCTSRHSLYLRKHITATQAPARRLQATGCLLFRSALLPARLGTAVVHDLHHVVSCRARPQEEVCAAEEAAGERRGWRPSGRPRPSVQRSYLQQAVVPTFRPTWVTLQEAASGGGANAAGAPL